MYTPDQFFDDAELRTGSGDPLAGKLLGRPITTFMPWTDFMNDPAPCA